MALFCLVSVINSATKQIVYTFEGSVYVQLATSPSGYESLYYGKDCDLTSCGQRVVGSLVSATFVSGVASFSVSILVKYLQTHSNIIENVLLGAHAEDCRNRIYFEVHRPNVRRLQSEIIRFHIQRSVRRVNRIAVSTCIFE